MENDISYHNRTVEEKRKSRSITYGGAIVAIDIITGEANSKSNQHKLVIQMEFFGMVVMMMMVIY